MAIYNPPTENLPIFDTSVFTNEEGGLSIAEGDARYLRFPVSQGSETISGALTIAGITTTNDLEPSSSGTTLDIATTQTTGVLNIGTHIDRSGTIQIGASTNPSAVARSITIGNSVDGGSTISLRGATINCGGVNSSSVSLTASTGGTVNVGTNNTSGSINIGRTDATTSTTVYNIATGSASTGNINIGSGASSKNITIGSTTGGATIVRGGTMNIQTPISGTIDIGTNLQGGTTNIATGTQRTGPINIGNGSASTNTGQINIGNGNSQISTINIGNGVSSTNTVSINSQGSGDTTIGNGTGAIILNSPITQNIGGLGITLSSQVGYMLSTVASTLVNPSATAANIGEFILGNGVWIIGATAQISGVPTASNTFFRVSLSKTTGTVDVSNRQDFASGGVGGTCYVRATGMFQCSGASTTIYYVMALNNPTGSTTTAIQVIATRIA